ncbi:MAG: class I SAM-dependent methyltransferase [Pseudomonadota bacterium]
MTTFDAQSFKETTRTQWDAVAQHWNDWGPVLDAWLGPATETMLDMAQVGDGDAVLHVAGGSGQEAIQSAKRVGAAGTVVSTDFSKELVQLANRNFEAAGLGHASAQLADGEDVNLAGDPFDAVFSRVGLIYFPDKVASLKAQIKAIKPGGHVGAIVYATGPENGFFSGPVGVIRRHANLPAPAPEQPGPFSLGDEGTIDRLFASVGLENVRVKKIDAPLVLGSAEECLRFEKESFGALHQMLAALDEDAKAAAWDEVLETLRGYETEDGFRGPCTLLVAVGQKPE